MLRSVSYSLSILSLKHTVLCRNSIQVRCCNGQKWNCPLKDRPYHALATGGAWSMSSGWRFAAEGDVTSFFCHWCVRSWCFLGQKKEVISPPLKQLVATAPTVHCFHCFALSAAGVGATSGKVQDVVDGRVKPPSSPPLHSAPLSLLRHLLGLVTHSPTHHYTMVS